MLLLATILTFTACGDDDDEPDYPSIVGTWYRIVAQEKAGNSTVTVTQTWIFNSNGSAQGIANVYIDKELRQEKTFDYTYKYDGKILTIDSDAVDATIANGRLTVTDIDGEKMIFNKGNYIP